MEDLFSSIPSVLPDLYVCSNSIISLRAPYYFVLLINVFKFIIFFCLSICIHFAMLRPLENFPKKLFLLVVFGFVCKAVTKACLRNNTHINKGLPVILLVVLYFWSVKLEA